MRKTDAFWDSSALVPLCVTQGASAFASRALQSRSVTVWWMTPIEMVGAFARLFRSEGITRADLDQALTRLVVLRNRWIEVLPGEQVRELAQLLIQRHPLRAADAAQLAAAVVWSKGQPRNRLFISLDGRLAEAASSEGFEVEAL